MKTRKLTLATILAFTLTLGCNEEELELQDPNVIIPETFFKSSGDLESAVNSGYSTLQSFGLYNRLAFFFFDNAAQENFATDALQPGLKQFMDYNYDASSGEIFQIWESCYRGVGACNFVIQAVADGLVENVPEGEINSRLGESRFLRGYYYYYLTTLWGDVPLVTEPPVDGEGFPKSTQAEIFDLILEDLTFAAANLPEKGNIQNGRATKGAAHALKAKALMFLERWEEAKTELLAVSGYTIEGVDPRDNGNEAGEFNPESIFEINFDKSIAGNPWTGNVGNGISETTFRGIEYSPVNFANVSVRNSFFDEYEPDDPRVAAYFYQDGDNYNNGESTFAELNRIVWRKYQNLDVQPEDGFEYSGINFRILRYADVLLMLAEVENELSNPTAAIRYLNDVRDRVDLPNYGTAEMDGRGFPVTSQAQIFEAVVHERAVELAGEQHRFLDLKRWGLDQDILVGFQVGKHERLPIPQAEIDANKQLTQADQNPGY